MTIKTIGQGIKTRLETISDLRAVYAPNELKDSYNAFPCAIIWPTRPIYHATFDNYVDLTFRVTILFSKEDAPTAFNKLINYQEESGDQSVLAAIEADRTLDGTASDCMVSRNEGATATTIAGHIYLSTEFEVLVWK